MNGESENEMEGTPFCYFTVYCIGAGIILFMTVHSEDLVWPLTCAVLLLERRLDTEVSCAMSDVRAMYQTTTSLQMANPGHQPIDETATYALSPRWDMDMVQ